MTSGLSFLDSATSQGGLSRVAAMAKPGRRPIPTQLKIIKGTDQPCRIKKDEPKPDDDNIEMPEGLSADAAKHWDKLCHQLQDAHIITNIDVTALSMYCEAYSTWVNANKKIQVHGAVIKGKGGFPVQSPYLMVANKAFEHMRSMLVEFGMTPSSRTRVSTTESAKKKNRFDDD